MIDYSLCDRTVTVYRMEQESLQRLVVDGCCYTYEDLLCNDVSGGRLVRKFLLVMPGNVQRVFVGDRIFDGVGPETVDWNTFLPANVPGLSVAEYVRPCWWGGDICHVEAGKK